MAGNTFGKIFTVTTFGESHGECVGCVIDGCPAGLKISEADIQKDLDRRRPGQSKITSPRDEKDKVRIMSGVFEGKTTGAPIMMMIMNENVRSEDYENLKNLYRPGHADFTYEKKYGVRDYRGGGRSSARETAARVMAGAVARKFLKEKMGMEFVAYVEQIADIKAEVDYSKVRAVDVEKNIMRCPDKKAAEKMIELVEILKKEGDSCGGIIRGVIRNVPAGLGEPVFDKLPADLGKAMLSINAVKGFEIGSGFVSAEMTGSSHNDEFVKSIPGDTFKIRTLTNNAGGVLGGISNGEDIYFRVAFKPASTISKEQLTLDKKGKSIRFSAKGRHDPCVVPRAVVIVEAMAAITMMDHYLRSL